MTHVFAFEDLRGRPLAEVRKVIGSKAANLAAMANELGLPVPPGFAVSTAACREYLAGGWPPGLEDEIRAHMARVEKALGRRFGDPADPLLVSVRSGAPVSMPGMMDTLLNLGLNSATAPGLARLSGDDVVRGRLPRPLGEVVPRHRRRPRAGGSLGGAARGGRSGLPLVEQRPGHRLSPARGHPRRTGHRRDRPGDGVRELQRRLGHRGALHPQPGHRGERPLRRRHVPRPGRGRRRRHPPDPAHHRARRTASRRGRRVAPLRRHAGAPLGRRLRHRVHHRTGQALDAADPRRQAHPSGGAAHRRRDGERPELPAVPSRGRAAGGPPAGRPAPRRRRAPGRRRRHHQGPGRLAGPGLRGDRHHPRGGGGRRRRGPAGHPRAPRHLARRRPRHGQGGRGS